MKFEQRMLNTTITSDWVDHMMDADDVDNAKQQLKDAMSWFERNHPAVGEVRTQSRFGTRGGYELRAIPKADADRDMVARGLKSVFYKVEQGEFADD